ncbi:hypothetical protein MMC10_007959 [Thelotrema lepadinum]|nr:hypothetical protein [Thelotrema lepadinum]
MIASLPFVAAFLSLSGHVVSASSPSVNISAGTLNGGQCSNSSSAVYYKSIPYAQPPTGNLRFAPPQPYTDTYPSGGLDATKSAPACIQFGQQFAEPEPTSEDCLFLDVWTPQNATADSKLPVRVWIYGGSNDAGGISDPFYDGCNVAASGVIIVSINYRLGPLGFLALQNASIQGNQAIQDQLLGLEWVQDNIEAFGGDSKKVLLYGQSAGALNTFTLSTLPQAPELFSSAAFESGGGRDAQVLPTEQAVGSAYAQALNCSISDASCLQSKSLDDLKSVYSTLPIISSGSQVLSVESVAQPEFAPYVDGQIIPTQPSEAGTKVPSIFGFNSQDGALFVASFYSNPTGLAEKDYTAFLTANWGTSGAALISKYLPYSTFVPTNTPGDPGAPGYAAIEYVYTAWQYQCPAYRGLNTAAKNGIPAWAYEFAHTPSCPWVAPLTPQEVGLLGPTHTAEIPFVFGNTQGLPRPNGTCNLNAFEQNLSAFMVGAWNSMAATQRPADNSTWPLYTGAAASLGLKFAENTTVPGPIDFSICDVFDQIDASELQNATAAANATSTVSAGSGPTGSNMGTSNDGIQLPKAHIHLAVLISLVTVVLSSRMSDSSFNL